MYPTSAFAAGFLEDPSASQIRGVQHHGPDANTRNDAAYRAAARDTEFEARAAMTRAQRVRSNALIIDEYLRTADHIGPLSRLHLATFAMIAAENAHCSPELPLRSLLRRGGWEFAWRSGTLAELSPDEVPATLLENIDRLDGFEVPALRARAITAPALVASALLTDDQPRLVPSDVTVECVGGETHPRVTPHAMRIAVLKTLARPLRDPGLDWSL